MTAVLTAFPNGVSSFGIPVIPGFPPTTGSVFFVHSSGTASSNGATPSYPVSTIDTAIGLCTASKGDVIVVMPGHAESISGAAAIACDVAGISIIGLGWGNLRPTITLHTAATTIAVSAANVTLRNLRLKTDVDAVVSMIVVSAAGCTIDAVDFVDTAACAPLQFVLTTAAADDLTIQNCFHLQSLLAATALQQWIVLVGADRVRILNNFFMTLGLATANPANGLIVGATTASLGVLIDNNRLISASTSTGDIPLSLLASSTGFVTRNMVASSKTAIAGQVACAGCYAALNYANNTVNLSGLLDPVVDS